MKLIGVDIFVHSKKIPEISKVPTSFELTLISDRGTKLWPGEVPNISFTDVKRCRFVGKEHKEISLKDILELLQSLEHQKLSWSMTHNLYITDAGENCFSV